MPAQSESQSEAQPVRDRDPVDGHTGARKIVWLGLGVHADETDGHIDNLACFARPGLVLLTWTDDTADPLYACCRDVFERLSRSTDAQGRAFEIVKLHHPGPLFMTADEARSVDTIQGSEPRQPGARLAGSYINHYICNGAVIVPLLDPARDQTAMEVLARAYPGRAMKGIGAREILLGGGNIHCIVQQQPAASG